MFPAGWMSVLHPSNGNIRWISQSWNRTFHLLKRFSKRRPSSLERCYFSKWNCALRCEFLSTVALPPSHFLGRRFLLRNDFPGPIHPRNDRHPPAIAITWRVHLTRHSGLCRLFRPVDLYHSMAALDRYYLAIARFEWYKKKREEGHNFTNRAVNNGNNLQIEINLILTRTVIIRYIRTHHLPF